MEKTTCDECGHVVSLDEREPHKPLVRNQDGTVLCVDCMAKQKKPKEKPLL
jgi:uncharacterized Zn finger protein (UPF0148 family)